MEVIMSAPARRSLVNIGSYISKHFGQLKSVSSVLDIKAFISLLATSPRMGKRVEEWSLHGEVRCAIHRQNQVYYVIHSDRVVVIAVWDSRQSQERLRKILKKFFEGEASQ